MIFSVMTDETDDNGRHGKHLIDRARKKQRQRGEKTCRHLKRHDGAARFPTVIPQRR